MTRIFNIWAIAALVQIVCCSIGATWNPDGEELVPLDVGEDSVYSGKLMCIHKGMPLLVVPYNHGKQRRADVFNLENGSLWKSIPYLSNMNGDLMVSSTCGTLLMYFDGILYTASLDAEIASFRDHRLRDDTRIWNSATTSARVAAVDESLVILFPYTFGNSYFYPPICFNLGTSRGKVCSENCGNIHLQGSHDSEQCTILVHPNRQWIYLFKYNEVVKFHIQNGCLQYLYTKRSER